MFSPVNASNIVRVAFGTCSCPLEVVAFLVYLTVLILVSEHEAVDT